MTAPPAEDDTPHDERTPAHRHPTLLELRSGQCRFPIGGFREPAHLFCGAPVLPGKPYCLECCQRAYVPARLNGFPIGSAPRSPAR